MNLKKKTEKNKQKDDLSFNGSFDDTEEKGDHERAVDTLDDLLGMKKLDENNPLERSEKFNMVRKHPVKPGYMEVKGYEVKNKDGDSVVVTVSKRENGSFKIVEHDPFMVVDPYMLFAGNIAQCPMNVVPMLIDQAEQQVELRKDTFIKKKEKRGEFNWWWIVFLILILVGIAPIAFVLLRMFGGG